MIKNREAITRAIEELGFRVNEIARGLKTNRSMTVGVLIPSLENLFFTSIVANIENVLQRSGYSCIICDYREDVALEKEKMGFLANKMVDGFIYMPLGHHEEYVASLVAQDIPFVTIDRPLQGVSCDTVLVDNLNAAYNAVEYLIVEGHRRIGIFCGPDSIYTARERLKGYERVHEDFQIAVERALVLEGDYSSESGYNLMEELLQRDNPPTAVFVTNYEMTLGAVMALNKSGKKVPDEISIIGFDNQQLARIVKPSLSIVVQPVPAIGETAATLLLKRLQGDQTGFPAMFRLKTDLVIGESVCHRE